MKFEIELSTEFVQNFMDRFKCTKKEVINILAASILEDKESGYYRDLSGSFDIDAYLVSHSISELATQRSNALSK